MSSLQSKALYQALRLPDWSGNYLHPAQKMKGNNLHCVNMRAEACRFLSVMLFLPSHLYLFAFITSVLGVAIHAILQVHCIGL